MRKEPNQLSNKEAQGTIKPPSAQEHLLWWMASVTHRATHMGRVQRDLEVRARYIES